MDATIAPPRPAFMPDTGGVPTVDLNADLGEAETVLPSDLAVIAEVSSANVACGFHAGNREVMRATCRAAVERGVAVGAHVSYRDREGFGRRPMEVPAFELMQDLIEQCRTLQEEAEAVGATVSYVKPHGALYHRIRVDPHVADVVLIATAMARIPRLLTSPGSAILALAEEGRVEVAFEGFADRAYRKDGSLVPRGEVGAVIDDPEEVALRAVSLAVDGGVEAVDGSWVEVPCHSICVHGDSPGAAAASRAVRAALTVAGVTIAPFAEWLPGRHRVQPPSS